MKFDHVALQTYDVPKTVDWYVDKLGAKVIKRYEDWAMVLLGNLTIAFTQPDKHPPHIAIAVDNVKDIPCDEKDVKKHRDGSLYYYMEDPNGNVIEWLYWPQKDRL